MDASEAPARVAIRTMTTSVDGSTQPARKVVLRGSRAAAEPQAEPTSHIWTRSHVTIFVRKVVNGRECFHTSPLDLAPFALTRGSLLSRVLQCIPCPAHSSSFANLSNALDKLKHDPEAKEILQARPAELTTWQIKSLFAAIELVAMSWPEATRYQRFTAVRAFFKQCDTPLQDGSRIRECKFTPQLFAGDQRSFKGGIPTTSFDSESTTRILDDFSSLDERNSKSLQKAIDAQEAILELCEITLQQHDEVKQLIVRARADGFPNIGNSSVTRFRNGQTPAAETILSQTPEDQLRIIIQLIDRKELYKNADRNGIPFHGLVQIQEYLAADSGQRVFELLLADKFLPRQVIVAHGITIMAVTGLNPETLYSLKSSNVQRQGNFVRIVGLKGRVDGFVVAILTETEGDQIKVNDKRAIQALEELVENVQQIEKLIGVKDLPLLVGLDYTNSKPTFYQFDFYKEYLVFWEVFGRPSIVFRELRRLAAHVELLSPGGSLYTVQALLNHKKASTSVEYINTKIIAELFEANIRRFMWKLEATALFRLGREDELAERGLTLSDVQTPLFPEFETLNSESRVDEWIQNNGDIEIQIGIAELRHCISQEQYYTDAYERLVSANPLRFVEVHLPRIIFCAAIRNLVEDGGSHAGLLRKVEREL